MTSQSVDQKRESASVKRSEDTRKGNPNAAAEWKRMLKSPQSSWPRRQGNLAIWVTGEK